MHKVPPLDEELWPIDNCWEGREDTNLDVENWGVDLRTVCAKYTLYNIFEEVILKK